MSAAGRKTRGWLLVVGLAAFGLSLLAPFFWAGRQLAKQQIAQLQGPTMGTSYAVTVAGAGAVAELQQRIAVRLAELNRRLSTYDPDSELSKFNQSVSTDWFFVAPETALVVEYALTVSADSAGSFDPTVGPLVNLWGFGPDPDREAPPSDEEIAQASAHVGYELLRARTGDEPSIAKSDTAVYVDLSAVAKGYGVDAIAEVVESFGFTDYLVEIGGEVVARGTKAGKPWRVGVEKASAAPPTERRLQRVIELSDRALATSGDYRNFFEHEGVRYSHTIDPKTGRPVEHDLATVTVLADTCMEADALATALLVMGPKVGYDWAVERELAVLFVRRTNDDKLVERVTPAWESQSDTSPDLP